MADMPTKQTESHAAPLQPLQLTDDELAAVTGGTSNDGDAATQMLRSSPESQMPLQPTRGPIIY